MSSPNNILVQMENFKRELQKVNMFKDVWTCAECKSNIIDSIQGHALMTIIARVSEMTEDNFNEKVMDVYNALTNFRIGIVTTLK